MVGGRECGFGFERVFLLSIWCVRERKKGVWIEGDWQQRERRCGLIEAEKGPSRLKCFGVPFAF